MKPIDEAEIVLVEDTDDVNDFIEWMKDPRPVLSIDTETLGLAPPHQNRIRVIQVGDPDKAWVIPWELWERSIEFVFHLYNEANRFSIHNMTYDIPLLNYHGVITWDTTKIDDTMLAWRVAEPHRPAQLEKIAHRTVYPGAERMKKALDEVFKRDKVSWDTVPIDTPEYWMYAGMDVILGSRLWHKAKEFGLLDDPHYRELELPAARAAIDMSFRGVKVDPSYVAEKCDEYELRVTDSKDLLLELGLSSALSTKQLARGLTDAGVVFREWTDAGNPVVDRRILTDIAEDEDATDTARFLARTTLDHRSDGKKLSSYFQKFLHLRDEDDRVHAWFHTASARTSRMSISNPSLQNVPKKSPEMRSSFVADEGNVLISCDFDQLQMRIMAHMSEDPGMIAAFHSEGDFFCSVAEQAYRQPIGRDDPRRQLVKNMCYALIFGAGVNKMAQMTGVPFGRMRVLYAKFARAYPRVLEWMKETEAKARALSRQGKTPYVTTPTGRRFYAWPGEERKLINYAIQGHEAELFKMCLVRAHEALGEYLLLPIHDEIVVECPEDWAEDFAGILQECMTVRGYRVPITSEAAVIGRCWGDKYK